MRWLLFLLLACGLTAMDPKMQGADALDASEQEERRTSTFMREAAEYRLGRATAPADPAGDAAMLAELERAERYVVALGSYSPQLLRPLGLRLPIYPLKGYSLTVPIVDAARAPRSTVLDETYKIALTRFDARIRIGGMAEVCGYDLSLDPRRRATLEMVCAQLFPGAGDLARGEFWTGLRPATPDGTPLVCGTPWPQLFINSGHGTLGWTMACGSARLLSDLILARPPQISSEGLDLSRYGS